MSASPCRQTHVYLCGLSPLSSTFLSSSRVPAARAHHSVISQAGLPSVPLPVSAHSQLGLSPAIFCCWVHCSSWAAPPLQSLLTGFLMLLREEPTCGQQMQQIMASASFHFSSCSLSLSSAFLGCYASQLLGKGPTVQEFSIIWEVKSLQSQVFKNNAEHFRCWTQKQKRRNMKEKDIVNFYKYKLFYY